MLSNYNTSLELLQVVQQEQLYKKLLLQIKKDFDLANVPIQIPMDVTPTQLKSLLHEIISFLIVENSPEYLHLLYAVARSVIK